MTDGSLLDTHTLLWLDGRAPIKPESRFEIGQASARQRLFFSHMSMWEVGVALHKKRLEQRPDLRGLSIGPWFEEVGTEFGIRPLIISSAIALEAASVPGVYGSGDPGDCFLIATARLHNLSLITRDAKIIDLANRRPDYIRVIPC